MDKFEFINDISYANRAQIVKDGLDKQKTLTNKVKNIFKYGIRVYGKYRYVENVCANGENIMKIINNFTTRNLLLMYACTKSVNSPNELYYNIECIKKCDEIIKNPEINYTLEFIESIAVLCPTYYWEMKITNNLKSNETEDVNKRENLFKQLKLTCLSNITSDHNYNLFILAFQLKPSIIKKLILLYVQICDDILVHKKYNKSMLTKPA